jgi:hypothetical protein
MTKAQSKLFVLQPVRRSGRARPPLLPALKKSTTRLREAATRYKGISSIECYVTSARFAFLRVRIVGFVGMMKC